jgi:hypothetical protein
VTASQQEQPQPGQAADITWTAELIRALGPTTDIPTLAAIMRCSTWKAYQMARTGQWEASGIRVIPIGSNYKVSVASILATLGYAGAQDGQPA